MSDLSAFFFPKSLAIVGASDDPKRIGGRLLANVTRGGFSGPVYPVNTSRATVQGRTAYPSIEDLPADVDLAAIAVGGEAGLDYVRVCLERTVRAAIVYASEVGSSSSDLSALLLAHGERAATRVIGPNSNGLINPTIGLYASFTSMLDRGLPRPGPVAVATQSAGVGASYTLEYLRRRSLGVGYWCHVGGEVDVTLAEVLHFYSSDADVKAVAVNLEMPRRPAAFISAVEGLSRAGKATVGFHAGSSLVGEAASATHTGVITSVRPRVLLGVAAQHGLHTMKSVRQTCNALEAFSYVTRPADAFSMAIVTTSGGVGVSLADALGAVEKVNLPRPNAQLRAELGQMVPFADLGNPIDLTAQVINKPEVMVNVLRMLDSAPEFNSLTVYIPSGDLGDIVADAIGQLSSASGQIVAVGLASDLARERLHRAGVPVFDEPRDLYEALTALFAAAHRGAPSHGESVSSAAGDVARSAVAGLRQQAARVTESEPGGVLVLNESASKACLRSVGIRTPRSARIERVDDLEHVLRTLMFPLVLKLLSPGVAHKAQRGHVRLPIRDAKGATKAASALLEARVREANGAFVVAEEMVLGVAEIFIGVRRDSDFGLLAAIARGGVDVESPGSRASVCTLPASRRDIAEMLASACLAIPPGHATVRVLDEITTLLGTLVELMEAGHDQELASIEVNPVIVERDGSCVVADALLTFSDTCEASVRTMTGE